MIKEIESGSSIANNAIKPDIVIWDKCIKSATIININVCKLYVKKHGN